MRRFSAALLSLTLLPLGACAQLDQGLYDVSNQVAPADRVTGQRSYSLAPRETQIKNSNSQTEAMLQKNYIQPGKAINGKLDAANYARLQRVFGRVHDVSHLSAEKWTAYLLPDQQWNAFTTGGTEIFVFEDLMKDLKSDDELAVVLGHEIAHVTANHIYEQQSQALAARVAGSKSATTGSYQAAFTLKNEEEADTIGILYAALAGYNPSAAADLWGRMYQSQGDFSAQVIDHPINSARYRRAQQLAATYRQYYIPGKINPDHAAILKAALGSQLTAPGFTPGQGAGVAAVLETAMDAYSKRNAAKTEELSQAQSRSLIEEVNGKVVVTAQQPVDAHTLKVRMRYNGAYAIKNLNMMAKAGEEMAHYRVPETLQPGDAFTATFPFVKTDLTKVTSGQFGVSHVEKAP